ncbi:hypothetical protein [Planomonospora venezuelensis]|uniref:DUF8094 domain-containing protein n=1 Tax=Planomonospora venezuelensis TaxID=1999 RepID=A0A841CXL8_PLAVE|nr:hypothetical protein [Planomonospora venezuelensis]MBB5962049.1 hypothetical protein [Planomonospora venezuelensis]GIN00149.1 putative lipoprotein [Planomonospora venezuelensis]
MRGNGRRGLLALALALTAAAAACSSGDGAAPERSPAAAGSTPVPAAARPQVTLAEAAAALKDVLSADEVLGSASPRLPADRNHLLRQAADGHLALLQAALGRSGEDLPGHTWGEPRLLVPRLERGPLWFAAVVDRRDGDGESRSAVLTVTGQGGKDWRISSLSLLDSALPEIALDAEGYATALGEDDPGVQISPRLMAPLHATTAEEGSAGFAAGLIAEGPHTTAHATEITATRAAEKGGCLGYGSIFAAAGYPVHALRTADGGALIMYSLIRTTTWTAKVYPCGELRAKVPEGREPDAAPLEEVRTVETQQYVSTVPPKTSRELARIIGYAGGITKVTSS